MSVVNAGNTEPDLMEAFFYQDGELFEKAYGYVREYY